MTTEQISPVPVCPVPVEERCCCVTIFRTLEKMPGVHSVRYDTAEPRLEVEYDPDHFDLDEHAGELDRLAHSIRERRAVCRDREQRLFRRGCGICVQQLLHAQRESDAPGRCDSAACTALTLMGEDVVQISSGVMVVRPPASPRGRVLTDAAPTEAIPIEKTPAGKTSASGATTTRVHRIDLSQRESASVTEQPRESDRRAVPWEPLFVGVALVSLVAGAILERRPASTAPVALVAFGLSYLAGGYFGLRAGIESLRERKIDVDLLMILAAVGAAVIGAPFEGALLLFLFSLSNVLQDYALDRTRSAIRALEKLKPESALVVADPTDQNGTVTPVDDIAVDQLVQVRPGDRIPLDGDVESGASDIDQSSVTGESIPVEKHPGDEVLAGTINQNGTLVIRVRKTSRESTIAKVITMVEEARENQAKTERFLDRFEQYYAIGVIGVTVLASFLPALLFGMAWDESVYKAITLMVAASPCALIISTPASILSAIGNGARRGVLFKGGVHMEQAGIVKVVAFDKTGTLTEGKPRLSDVTSLSDLSEEEVLRIAAALEMPSEHVIARAIVAGARERNISIPEVESFRSESGVGVGGTVQNRPVRIAGPAILDKDGSGQEDAARAILEKLEAEAKTAVVLRDTAADQTLGVLAVKDRIRPESRRVVAELKEAGVARVVMLTGDNQRTAEAIGAEAGVDQVFAALLPEDKLTTIRSIEEQYGPTAMVGDGVNDAPALAGARLGIAMGAAGTDVALETADVVLLSDELEKVPYLIALSRRTRRTLVTNLSVAMGLIAMMVIGIYTIDLPLPLAVVGHEGGTVLVSLNGLRLLMFKHRRQKPSHQE